MGATPVNATRISRQTQFARNALLGLLLLAGGACTPSQSVQPQTGAGLAKQAQDASDLRNAKLIQQAMKLIKAHKSADAIDGPLHTVISEFEAAYGTSDKTYYCARETAESLLYLMTAVNRKTSAIVLGPEWADAYHLEGFALIDLGRLDEAQAVLKKAVALSPENALYLSELAYTYQLQQHLATALDIYTHAEEAARTFSPKDVKTLALTRALRGQGFVLSDMHRLDEAESRYRASLKIDPNDEKAKHELEYITELRQR